MKSREGLQRHYYAFLSLCFAAQAWDNLHGHAVGEAVFYSIALAASLFLTALPLSVWHGKQAEQGIGREEHQEETSP